MLLAAENLLYRFRTAQLVVRGFSLLKGLGPYAAIELLLPGGSLIALGLWLYSRHKSGKPLLPFGLRPAVRRVASPDLLNRRLSALQERGDMPVAGVAFGG